MDFSKVKVCQTIDTIFVDDPQSPGNMVMVIQPKGFNFLFNDFTTEMSVNFKFSESFILRTFLCNYTTIESYQLSIISQKRGKKHFSISGPDATNLIAEEMGKLEVNDVIKIEQIQIREDKRPINVSGEMQIKIK